ncbi:MAG: hypothetical protein ACLQPH_09035 [Acidimicrobiales bacterium]
MIHILTVHWMDPKWIDPQLAYLERNVEQPFRTWASLEGITDPADRARFDVVEDAEGMHADKLNALAGLVLDSADADDLLVFIDGDAFPVRPIAAWLDGLLGEYPLVAVRRDENRAERQPHPSFCATTVGFWQEIGGDWREGGTWKSPGGADVTDVGGTLYNQLQEAGVDWLPLLRSNTSDLHPLWFGVYAEHVYHHGAGFRRRVSRVDVAGNEDLASPRLRDTARLYRQRHARPTDLLRRINPTTMRRIWRGLRQELPGSAQSRYLDEATALSEGVYRDLVDNPEFYRRFEAASRS